MNGAAIGLIAGVGLVLVLLASTSPVPVRAPRGQGHLDRLLAEAGIPEFGGRRLVLACAASGTVCLVAGAAVSVVLVHVVNPQSFHWTMDLLVPWLRLGALCAAVVAAGTLTAWLAGRAAAGRDAVLAVKEDW